MVPWVYIWGNTNAEGFFGIHKIPDFRFATCNDPPKGCAFNEGSLSWVVWPKLPPGFCCATCHVCGSKMDQIRPSWGLGWVVWDWNPWFLQRVTGKLPPNKPNHQAKSGRVAVGI